MSERFPSRRPQTFRLDDPGVVVLDGEDTQRPLRGTIQITPVLSMVTLSAGGSVIGPLSPITGRPSPVVSRPLCET